MTLEERVALLENQTHELYDVLEQIAKDLELTEANITRTLKGVQPQKTRDINSIAVNEVTFTSLKYDQMQGLKIGEFEIASKTSDNADKFTQAYNILKQSNATIKSRYHGKTYVYSYWLYEENKIYRQKLKEPQQ